MSDSEVQKYEGYDPIFYDLTFGKQTVDADFYKSLVRGCGGKVLEVACGSGRVYLKLLEQGTDVYGIDLSEEMLTGLREKAAAMGLVPKVFNADMRNFSLDHAFEYILIPARSFLHNITPDDQVSALKCCREHLADGGKLVINFFYPNRDVMAGQYGKDLVSPLVTGDFKLITRSDFSDEPDQVLDIAFTWYKEEQEVSRFRSRLAIIFKREFELLLRLTGFSRWQVYGGFDYQPLTSRGQEMVWVIEK
jgi:SAM-dependent methyltransferase